MGVFHFFYIAQIAPNCATHHEFEYEYLLALQQRLRLIEMLKVAIVISKLVIS